MHSERIPNQDFYTRKLFKPIKNSQSPSHNKTYAQEMLARSLTKTMHLEKMKLENYLRIKNKNNSPQEKVQLRLTQSQSLNNYPSPHTKRNTHSHNKFHIIQNSFRLRQQNKPHKLLTIKKNQQSLSNEDIRNSFKIKQLKPQPKQVPNKQDSSSQSAVFGKSYGSYYQIVALQKRFESSRYFENQHPPIFNRTKFQYIEKKYRSRIVNPQSIINKPGIDFSEGSFFEPWKLNEERNQSQTPLDQYFR